MSESCLPPTSSRTVANFREDRFGCVLLLNPPNSAIGFCCIRVEDEMAHPTVRRDGRRQRLRSLNLTSELAPNRDARRARENGGGLAVALR
eukprot:3808052-Pleurochrysis_carterae.AAC.1